MIENGKLIFLSTVASLADRFLNYLYLTNGDAGVAMFNLKFGPENLHLVRQVCIDGLVEAWDGRENQYSCTICSVRWFGNGDPHEHSPACFGWDYMDTLASRALFFNYSELSVALDALQEEGLI